MLTLVALVAVMACSLWNTAQVVQVDATEVQCEGEVSLTADECASWGAELLTVDGSNGVETLTITTRTSGGRMQCRLQASVRCLCHRADRLYSAGEEQLRGLPERGWIEDAVR